MIAKLFRKLFRKKETDWWKDPSPGYLDQYLDAKYGQPGTDQGDKPIEPQNEHGSGIRIMPRWYKEGGYQQPTNESKF